MVVPLVARCFAAAFGGLLVLTSVASVVGTLIVPRPVSTWLTKRVDQLVNLVFRGLSRPFADYYKRDRVLAAQAATLLICQIAAWLGMFFIGFALLFWPLINGGITQAFSTAGPALWEIGADHARGAAQVTIQDIASIVGLITITLQIAYLPTLYAAFNRRETEVALLTSRAGVPSWGPELLARTHYGLGSGLSTIDSLPEFYDNWDRWAADMAESHTTYLPLVRFRSPRPRSSWIIALLAVLDSAALILALSPEAAPEVEARLFLRSGFICVNDIARAMGFAVPEEPDPTAGIQLSYEEFLDAVERLREVDFPIERKPEDAWPEFVGWRVNYEPGAYALAAELDAVRAPWSGPRKIPGPVIQPFRPGRGRQPK